MEGPQASQEVSGQREADVPDSIEAFAGHGCVIERTEDRGIQLHQLGSLVSHIHKQCSVSGWVDRDGKPLSANEVNLYVAMEYVIKPCTQARQCSFVELVADSAQPTDWFVSHWWGESIAAFSTCLGQHKEDRNLPRTTAYWVCAYANNQWRLDEDLGTDPGSSSFRRAMSVAKGTISVLDEQAACYTRIWCIYEIFISVVDAPVNSPGYLYDVYTCRADEGGKGGAVGITDGPVSVDGNDVKQARRKRHREFRFPWELQDNALSIELQTAEASREEDRRRILNVIAGQADLTAVPAVEHPSYTRLNAELRGRFAASAWVKAVDRREDLERLRASLVASEIPRLALHFGGNSTKVVCDADMEMLANGLPMSLRYLFVGCAGCKQITNASLYALGSRVQELRKLEAVELRFSAVKALTTEGVVGLVEGLAGLQELEELVLMFDGCRVNKAETILETLAPLAATLQRLRLRGVQVCAGKGLSDDALYLRKLAVDAEQASFTTSSFGTQNGDD